MVAILLFALSLTILWVAILWVDRPLALLCFRLVGHTRLRKELDSGLVIALVAPVLVPVLCLRPRLSGLAALAGGAGWAVNLGLRELIGRSRPDPLFLYLHEYGFHPGHPALWWSSFPSGTAAVSAAWLAVVVRAEPRLRMPGLLLAGLLWTLVVLSNAHWLSDVLAGALLGAGIGSLVETHLGPRFIRLDPPRV